MKHRIKDSGGNILYMAGLYREVAKGREFVILTKEATEKMTEIHDRIPVLMKANQIEGWFSGSITIEELCEDEYDIAIEADGS